MNAPFKIAPERLSAFPEIAAALKAYDTATTDRERNQALALIAQLRAARRQGGTI
jgi:hypothetical protein